LQMRKRQTQRMLERKINKSLTEMLNRLRFALLVIREAG